MGILDIISSPRDLRSLDGGELNALCDELRAKIIDAVAQSGGHLSSNLGAVELTVALHRVYDTARDRLVFDVGHQCYAHKLLTGRKDAFSRLRTLGGASGFPKPSESVHDAFIAGHASNSVSAALGLARARTAAGGDYDVAALIGDGALTGGLAYEGLSDAGGSGEPMVVVLNDNGMSIQPSVGGMAKLLAALRVKPGYFRFKRGYRRVVRRFPWLYSVLHRVKERVKRIFLPGTIFEDFGFYYLGPVDGHDLAALEAAIGWARELSIPVLLHVITVKGKGLSYAEEHPDEFHGVSCFDPGTGMRKGEDECFSSVFGNALTELAGKDTRIFAVTAAMESGTGLTPFAGAFPSRFFDVGIAEGHAVTMSAGLAMGGMLPVFAVYSTFLQRGFDMLIHDIALMGLHAVFAVDRAGLACRDGETHHGAFDIAYLSAVPGMTVLAPSSFAELRSMLKIALFETDGPVALRYPRGGEGRYCRCSHGDSELLREGDDITLVSYGIMINEALSAAEILGRRGISAGVVKLNRVVPPDCDIVASSVAKTSRTVFIEDVCSSGCAGEKILSALAARGTEVKGAKLLNLGNGIIGHGSQDELLKLAGLDADSIANAAGELVYGR